MEWEQALWKWAVGHTQMVSYDSVPVQLFLLIYRTFLVLIIIMSSSLCCIKVCLSLANERFTYLYCQSTLMMTLDGLIDRQIDKITVKKKLITNCISICSTSITLYCILQCHLLNPSMRPLRHSAQLWDLFLFFWLVELAIKNIFHVLPYLMPEVSCKSAVK